MHFHSKFCQSTLKGISQTTSTHGQYPAPLGHRGRNQKKSIGPCIYAIRPAVSKGRDVGARIFKAAAGPRPFWGPRVAQDPYVELSVHTTVHPLLCSSLRPPSTPLSITTSTVHSSVHHYFHPSAPPHFGRADGGLSMAYAGHYEPRGKVSNIFHVPRVLRLFIFVMSRIPAGPTSGTSQDIRSGPV